MRSDSANDSSPHADRTSDSTVSSPPLWAWELKNEIDSLRSLQEDIQAVKTLQEKMEKLLTKVDNLQLNSPTQTNKKTANGETGSTETDKQKTNSDHQKELEVKPPRPLKPTASIDVLKVAKRARQISNLEGGAFQGTGDPRGFIAMRREVLSKPEFVYATTNGEEGAAIEYFYVMNNISPALQQQVATKCTVDECDSFEDRVSTMWDCLRISSDLNDQLSLIRRWETLRCASGNNIEDYISQIEGLREQLQELRKMPLSDAELRSRLYTGLPDSGRQFLDSLPTTAVDTYKHMLFEARRWAQLHARYSAASPTTSPNKTFRSQPQSTRSPPTTRGAARRQGNVAELFYSDIDNTYNPDAKCVFVSGIPREWDFRQVKSLVQDLLGDEVSAYVTMLPRRGCVSLRFQEHADAQKFIETSNGVRFSGRLLRSRFDKYERPSPSSTTPETGEPVVLTMETTFATSRNTADMALQTDDGNAECSIGVVRDVLSRESINTHRVTSNPLSHSSCDSVPSQATRGVTRQVCRTTSGLPRLTVEIGASELSVEALLDSGASDVFMSIRLFKHLQSTGETFSLQPCDTQVGMINGSGCNIIGKLVGLPVKFGHRIQRQADCFVLESSKHDLVLPQHLLGPCVWRMTGRPDHPDELLFAADLASLPEALVPTASSLSSFPVACNVMETSSSDSPVVNDDEDQRCCEVAIPWKGERRPPQNFDQVWRRDQKVVQRLRQDPMVYRIFCQAVDELFSAGVVDIMPQGEDPKLFAEHYIATVPVVNLSRTSTKVRLCLDARQLNSYTNTSSDEEEAELDLFSTLIQWRSGNLTTIEDLSKAFWSVSVDKADRSYLGMVINQVIVRWRVVPFGTNWSPWALTSSLRKTLNTLSPIQSSLIGCYMDDLVIFGQDLEELVTTRDAAVQALQWHGFKINESKRAHNMTTHDYAIGLPRQPDMSDETLQKASWLGYRWFIGEEFDVFDVKLPDFTITRPVTMTKLRSIVARLYDPLGIVAELTLELRYLMRRLTKAGYGNAPSNAKGEILNDDDADAAIDTITWCDNILKSDRVWAPRYTPLDTIYAFADASEASIGIDIRTIDGVRLVARMTTVPGGSIPRRELESIRLLLVTLQDILRAARGSVHNCIILGDSSITLFRIKALLRDPTCKKVVSLPRPERRRLDQIYNMVRQMRIDDPHLTISFCHIRSMYNLADRLTRPRSLYDPSNTPTWTVVKNELNEPSLVAFKVNEFLRFEDDEVIDTLSDSLSSDASPMDVYPKEVNTTESVSWSYNFKQRVLVAQSADPFCVHTLACLRDASGNCSLAKYYRIDDDNGLLLNYLWKHDDWVPLVPANAADLQLEAISHIHILYKHPGIKATKDLVEQVCTFKNINREVKRYIRACETCAVTKAGRMLTKTVNSLHCWVKMVWGIVGLDLYGPLPTVEKSWVLIGTDYITKLVSVRLVNNPSASEVSTAFIEMVATEGAPKVVVSDRGSCFTASTFKQTLSKYNIVQALCHPNDPAQRGWLERGHKEFGALLRASALEDKASRPWSLDNVRRWISLAAFTINCLPYPDADDPSLCPWVCCRASNGIAESSLGDDVEAVQQARQWLGSGLLFEHLPSDLAVVRQTCSDEWSLSLRALQDLWMERRAQVRRRLARSRRIKNEKLGIGDTVWKKNFAADKFSNLFTGPFSVVGIDGVTVSICDGDGSVTACGIHQLKRGGPKIKMESSSNDNTQKNATTQTTAELSQPAFDETDLKQWRDAAMNDGIMTRSRKRALDKMDKVIEESEATGSKIRRC